MLIRPFIFADEPEIAAAFTTRRGGASRGSFASLNLGMSTGDDRELVARNRELVLKELGFIPEQMALGGQIHGSAVKVVDGPAHFDGFDGLVTREKGIVLGILAADCAAVLLADVEAGVIGACHAGWRGAVGGVVEKTVAAMSEVGARPYRTIAYISPCISQERFEVGSEVAGEFDEAFVRRNATTGRPHVDLRAYLGHALVAAGLNCGQIEASPQCTYSDRDSLFSYRRDGARSGRMMGLIGIRQVRER